MNSERHVMHTEALSPEMVEKINAALRDGALPEEDLRQLLLLLQAHENFPKNHPIACYRPIERTRSGAPHALAFHQAPHAGRGIFGGNQSSKTYSGTMEDAFHFCNVYPDWYPKAQRLPERNTGRIIVKDFPHSVAEVIEPALMRAIAPRFIAERKTNNKGFLTKLKSRTGASFDIVTHDMDTLAIEGWQGHWAHFDEPPPRDKFIATTRGLVRNAGRWWITCTPLSEPWMYDEIYTNPNYFMITVDMRDNPYLTEEAIAVFESQLTEDEKEARLHGRFMHLSGLVYKEFDPAAHVKPRMEIPADWPRWCICDPHSRRPFAFLWLAIDPFDRIWIYDEWPSGWFHEMRSSTNSLKDYVHIMREKEMGQTIYRRIIDGRAGKVPIVSGERQESLIDALQELGLVFEPSYITTTLGITDPGHLAIKERLRISPVTSEPSIFVLENCRNTIYAFQHNVWQEARNMQIVSERPSEFAKDFLDCVRYGLMDEPHWMEQNPGANQPAWIERNIAEADERFGTFGSEF